MAALALRRAGLLLIGVGNAWRGDDGAGPAVAEALTGRLGLDTLISAGDGTELIEAWCGRDQVIVVDAMRSGAPAGTIHRFDAVLQPLPRDPFANLSHRLGLPEAVEIALGHKLINWIPKRRGK